MILSATIPGAGTPHATCAGTAGRASNRSSIVLNTLSASNYPLDDALASNRIQERLRKARRTFRANDNIAAFIEDGELDELRLEVEDRMREVLEAWKRW